MSQHVIEIAGTPTQLSELVDEAVRNGEVVVTRGGAAVARIVPVRQPRGSRQFGSARGLVSVPDDFDVPLTDFDESH